MCAVLLVGWAPTMARAEPGDRVVRGSVSIPTVTNYSSRNFSAVAVSPRCRASDAGVQGTGFLLDRVTPGRTFELTADAGSWNDDFDITFYGSRPSGCDGTAATPSLPYTNHAGDERAVVPAGAEFALVTLVTGRPGAAFTYRELAKLRVKFAPVERRKPTVVAVVEPADENGFSPYHFDFLGHQHPWNTDEDVENDFDFAADPQGWLPGYPGAIPVQLTLPDATQGDVNIHELAGTRDASGTLTGGVDSGAWNSVKGSDSTITNLYRFPGTKVVGAVNFGEGAAPGQNIYGDNDKHGTRSASVAAGNTHGTCPECVFVLVLFDDAPAVALEWVAKQPWIDVVTNSWSQQLPLDLRGAFGDEAVRRAVEGGQTWVWASGNGEGSLEAGIPNQTYSWGPHAGDWNVLVGGVMDPYQRSKHSGRSVDLASHFSGYPSAGGATAAGRGVHTGTSNAAPVVAGTFAKVIQWGRDLIDDSTPGHHERLVAGRLEGVVGEGEPRPCAGPVSGCALDDGILTRAEVQSTVFENVLPAAVRPPSERVLHLSQATLDEAGSTPSVFSYTHQGHGVVNGRIDQSTFVAEQRRFLDALRGAVRSLHRPPGEANWMFADSKCRQRLWGEWAGGYYRDGAPDPVWDPSTDQPAMALNAACTPLPKGVMRAGMEAVRKALFTPVFPFCVYTEAEICIANPRPG